MADAPAAAVRAVSAAILVNLVAVLSLFLTGAMSVQIGASMGVSAVRVGMLASVFAAATVAGSAPLGRMVGRWGIRRNLTVSAWWPPPEACWRRSPRTRGCSPVRCSWPASAMR